MPITAKTCVVLAHDHMCEVANVRGLEGKHVLLGSFEIVCTARRK
jgi:hypothetical protein